MGTAITGMVVITGMTKDHMEIEQSINHKPVPEYRVKIGTSETTIVLPDMDDTANTDIVIAWPWGFNKGIATGG